MVNDKVVQLVSRQLYGHGVKCVESACDSVRKSAKKSKSKTYNSGDSLAVTHLIINPPIYCLYMAERTGSLAVS